MSSTPSPPDPSPVSAHERGATLDLLVQPRAPRDEIGDVHDGALRLRLTAPPVEGAANSALVEFLAKRLDVRRSDLTILSGERSRRKRVLVAGVTRMELETRLGLRQNEKLRPAASPEE